MQPAPPHLENDMNTNPTLSEQSLRDQFVKQLNTLKLNREMVPLNVLKTEYKKGYEKLCKDLKFTGTKYAKQLTLTEIRFQKEYVQEGADRINRIIEQSGLMRQLSKAIFSEQNIDHFEALCSELRLKIQNEANLFYREHLGLFITEDCLLSTNSLPMVFSFVNGCVLIEDKWVPKEIFAAPKARKAIKHA